MNFDNIEKKSILYLILRTYAKVFFRLYYKKNYITNFHKFPRNQPTIMVSNHQNTLMDPLAAIFASREQVVFLARADIFKNPIAAKILKIIKVMPVYRKRDVGNTVEKNDEIFNKSIEIINNKMPFALFPEGTHYGQRRLRALKKGFARIAFHVAELNDLKTELKIAPVTVDYSDYENSGSTLLVNFGDPIDVADYIKEYKENAPKAFNSIKNEVSRRLKSNMIHIQSTEYYEVFYELKEIYHDKMIDKLGLPKHNHPNRFIAGKKIVENLDNYLNQKPDEVEKLAEKTRKYQEIKKQFNFKEWLLNKEKYSVPAMILQIIFMLVTFPIFLFGAVHNAIPYLIPRRAIKKVKDRQFHSTTKYVYAMALFPLTYSIIFILVFLLADIWWIKLAYIALVPLTGVFAYRYKKLFLTLISKFRYNKLATSKNENFKTMRQLRTELLASMEKINK